MIKVDLHTHTTASDGTLSPLSLLDRAESRGITHLAITDHDTIDGLFELQNFTEKKDFSVKVIPGIELTTNILNNSFHILGLWVDIHNTSFKDFLKNQKKVRQERAIRIGDILEKKGIKNAFEGAKRIASNSVVGRPHFAQFLVENGYCDKARQAYATWLGNGKVADVKVNWPSIDKVVDIIHKANGVAVLAHPNKYGLTKTKLRNVLSIFKSQGGDGIEVINGRQEKKITDYLLGLSHKFDMACSVGSDFHSPLQPWSDLGLDLDLPSSAKPIWEVSTIRERFY